MPIAVVDTGTNNSNMITYVIADGQDTPRVITNLSGTVIWNWPIKGNPFGDKLPAASPGYEYNWRYPGQYYDAELGMYYNINRYYAPGSGRYTQVDPMGFAGGQWSLYAYVMNDPLGNTDPDGLQVASGGIPMSIFPSYAYGQSMSAQERNVFATGFVQLTPAGLALTLAGRSFNPFGDGATFQKDGASAWDIMTGLLNGSVGAANSNLANSMADAYMDARYRDLSLGNKAMRREFLAANQIIWSESKGVLGMVGKGLGPLGAITTFVEMGQKLNDLNSCAR